VFIIAKAASNSTN